MELRELVEECMVAVELGQHEKVSSLTPKICIQLVDLVDNEILELEEARGAEGVAADRDSSCVRLVDVICQRIREKGELAAAYNNVLEFVRIRDLVCLSKLVGSVPDKQCNNELALDFDRQARILRQSIYLLKSIYSSSGGTGNSSRKEVWLDGKNVDRTMAIGFPIYQLDVGRALVRRESQQQGGENSISDQISYLDSGGALKATLTSHWFCQFVDATLEAPYPLDRFTVLVAIWIIGSECKHKALEQLVGELVDQIAHEETNSSNQEDLMQLTQVGSFWLSYHKRHQATLKRLLSSPTGGEDDGELSDIGSSESPPSSQSAGSMFMEEEEAAGKGDIIIKHTYYIDWRLRLKRIIDEELLHGVQCAMCCYHPTQLLEPLNTDSCPECANGPVERCSLSYRPLELFSLAALVNSRPKLSRIVLVSPNEWTRIMISGLITSKVSQGEAETKMAERVDISENFERLTVIRDTEPEEPESLSDDSDDSVPNESANNDHLNCLRVFARLRARQPKQFSESLRMLKCLGFDRTMLPLCSSDLLILESLDSLSKVRLIGNSKSLFGETGRLWSCATRSTISQLMLGCSRLFASTELVRRGQGGIGEFTCPFCELNLSELRSVYDGLTF